MAYPVAGEEVIEAVESSDWTELDAIRIQAWEKA